MSTLGLTNFGSLSAPIQPLSDFDNILGEKNSATQGAGILGYDPTNAYPAGSAGAALKTLSPAIPSGGATGSRPAIPVLYQSFFDTTIGQPIWCTQVSPAIWVNSAGVAV